MPTAPTYKITAQDKRRALTVLATAADIQREVGVSPGRARVLAAEMNRDLIHYDNQLRSAMAQAGSPQRGPSLGECAVAMNLPGATGSRTKAEKVKPVEKPKRRKKVKPVEKPKRRK
jgi:hypothetical protein